MVNLNVTIDSNTVKAGAALIIGYGICRGIIILCEKVKPEDASKVLECVAKTQQGHLLVEEQACDPLLYEIITLNVKDLMHQKPSYSIFYTFCHFRTDISCSVPCRYIGMGA